MAGTVTVGEETFGSIRKILWTWTSTAGGAADLKTTKAFNGKIEALITVPDATDAPTTLYDIVVEDEEGIDVLKAAGADRSATATEQVLSASLGIVANDTLNLKVTNAGASKKGKVYLYLR